jgi:hypothetical protein
MADKKSPKKPSALIPSPSGSLSTSHLQAFKSKPATRKPNQRQSHFGK